MAVEGGLADVSPAVKLCRKNGILVLLRIWIFAAERPSHVADGVSHLFAKHQACL
jgi:hypothetical protein